jgi:hypothetical protein
MMKGFWAVFDQQTPLQEELPQPPIESTDLENKPAGERNHGNASGSQDKLLHPLTETTNTTTKPDGAKKHYIPCKYDWASHLPDMVSLYYSGISIPRICKAIQDEASGFTPG